VGKYKIQEVTALYELQHEIYKTKPSSENENKKRRNETKNKLTEIMTSVLRYERLAETTNIRVIELFQDTDLSPEDRGSANGHYYDGRRCYYCYRCCY
jgi:hypothetical protein